VVHETSDQRVQATMTQASFVAFEDKFHSRKIRIITVKGLRHFLLLFGVNSGNRGKSIFGY